MKKDLIIDGHNLLFRSYFGVPQAACLPSGLKINAVYGFLASLKKIHNFSKPDLTVVVFDSETGISEKTKANSSYKANREFSDLGMFEQLPIIKKILENLSIVFLEHPNFEADDVIGSLAVNSANRGVVDIFSNDRDFIQLINKNIFLVRETRGKMERLEEKSILDNYGFRPKLYLDHLSIKGDVSDNISGIFGIGEKTSAGLVKKYGEIENIWKNLDKETPRVKKLMKEEFNKVLSNKNLLKINSKISLKIKLKKNGSDLEEKLKEKTNTLLKNCGYK